VITAWHDRRITAGSDLDQSISSELESAKIILLLVSAQFIASDYCYEKEMKLALERAQEGSAVVIPVILHPCDWQTAPFGHLRATPMDGKPVSMYANHHEAFAIIAKDVREAAGAAAVPRSTPERLRSESSEPPAFRGSRSSNLRIKKRFSDHERDKFLEDSYDYIARYLESSLQELSARNPQIKTEFKRLNATSCAAFIYEGGERVARCSVWFGGVTLGSPGIAYSESGDARGNSFNESLSIADDGYTLQLKPLGLPMSGGGRVDALSPQGAAEYYWGLLIRPLQR
jgi:hypothetical protein